MRCSLHDMATLNVGAWVIWTRPQICRNAADKEPYGRLIKWFCLETEVTLTRSLWDAFTNQLWLRIGFNSPCRWLNLWYLSLSLLHRWALATTWLWAICLCHLLTACHRNILLSQDNASVTVCQRRRRPNFGCLSGRTGSKRQNWNLLIVMKLFVRLKTVSLSLERNSFSTALHLQLLRPWHLWEKQWKSLWRSQHCSTFSNAVVGFHLASELRNYQRLTGIELFKVNLDKQHAHQPSLLISKKKTRLRPLGAY